MLDVGKLIRVKNACLHFAGFSSMLDVGKLIPIFGFLLLTSGFSSMLDVGKLIRKVEVTSRSMPF